MIVTFVYWEDEDMRRFARAKTLLAKELVPFTVEALTGLRRIDSFQKILSVVFDRQEEVVIHLLS